ncbi:PorP/SprF family type IX secretion system membrane protein [Flavobacterium sp. RS13.1]|uniref:PorP/SprF family type IX secretion system membrane protein n=1 Tax=Flavobacterium sp. RS13.1 TaxID=3400345 RepID=UPI003AAA9155
MTNNFLIRTIIAVSFTLQMSFVFAQQTPVFANYSYNTVVINPAHSGYYDDTDVTLINSGFFNSVEGSPKNLGLTINAPLRSKHLGLAAGISTDEIGVTTATSFFGAYSYKIFFDSDYNQGRWWAYDPNILSFGISAGGTKYSEDLLSLNIENDPEFQNNVNAFVPTLGVGVLYNKDRIYLGISAPNILGNSLSSERNINLKNPYYTYFGYRFFTTQLEEVLVNPSILLKYVSGAALQADFNVMINYINKVEFGAGYRTSETVNLLAGFHLGTNFKLLYNYSYALKTYNNINTHGIILNYRFGKGYEEKGFK